MRGQVEGEPPPDNLPSDECVAVHVVARGNTLYKIAEMYNTTVAQVVERNHLPNPNMIYVDQKLCIVGP